MLIIAVIALALLGGAVEFVDTKESWSFVLDKETVFGSVKNGAIVAFDFTKETIENLIKKIN
jgi:hypothetical protein